jgi:nucleoside transporter
MNVLTKNYKSLPLYYRLAIMQVLQYFVWGSWYVTIGTYLIKGCNFTGGDVGWVYASPGMAAMLMPFLMGVLADKYFPIQKILASLHFIGSLLLIFSAQFTSFATFFPAILLYSFCYQPTFSLTSSLCFSHLKDPTTEYPRVRVWGTTGWIFGGLIVSFLDWEASVMPLYVSAAASVILSIYCLTLPHTPPLGKDRPKRAFYQWLKNQSLLFLMGIMLLVMIPASFYYSFVNTFLVDSGVRYAAAKMSIGQISEIMVMLALPLALAKFKWRKVITIGIVVWGIRYGIFLLDFDGEWHYYLSILLHGFAYCFSALAAQLYVNKIAPPEIRSSAQGFFSFLIMGVGTMVGSFIAGYTVSAYTDTANIINWDGVWMVASALGFGFALLFWVFRRFLVE